MATLLKTPVYGFEKKPDEDFEAYLHRTEKLLARYKKHADSLDPGFVTGALLTFPVADGCAIYLVASSHPLKLQHIPFADAWRADPALIRGLRLEDVKLRVARSQGIAKIFGKK